jgi:hypothetical protein
MVLVTVSRLVVNLTRHASAARGHFSNRYNKLLLLRDGCERGCHQHCLSPPLLKLSPWHCPGCRPGDTSSASGDGPGCTRL